ncbi:unnamed protein product [Amoebophrya sp. A25]|nr:unnamed protein product [Amoebophrya sp. A25]|eukprot:GSA25T00004405001.1
MKMEELFQDELRRRQVSNALVQLHRRLLIYAVQKAYVPGGQEDTEASGELPLDHDAHVEAESETEVSLSQVHQRAKKFYLERRLPLLRVSSFDSSSCSALMSGEHHMSGRTQGQLFTDSYRKELARSLDEEFELAKSSLRFRGDPPEPVVAAQACSSDKSDAASKSTSLLQRCRKRRVLEEEPVEPETPLLDHQLHYHLLTKFLKLLGDDGKEQSTTCCAAKIDQQPAHHDLNEACRTANQTSHGTGLHDGPMQEGAPGLAQASSTTVQEFCMARDDTDSEIGEDEAGEDMHSDVPAPSNSSDAGRKDVRLLRTSASSEADRSSNDTAGSKEEYDEDWNTQVKMKEMLSGLVSAPNFSFPVEEEDRKQALELAKKKQEKKLLAEAAAKLVEQREEAVPTVTRGRLPCSGRVVAPKCVCALAVALVAMGCNYAGPGTKFWPGLIGEWGCKEWAEPPLYGGEAATTIPPPMPNASLTNYSIQQPGESCSMLLEPSISTELSSLLSTWSDVLPLSTERMANTTTCMENEACRFQIRNLCHQHAVQTYKDNNNCFRADDEGAEQRSHLRSYERSSDAERSAHVQYLSTAPSRNKWYRELVLGLGFKLRQCAQNIHCKDAEKLMATLWGRLEKWETHLKTEADKALQSAQEVQSRSEDGREADRDPTGEDWALQEGEVEEDAILVDRQTGAWSTAAVLFSAIAFLNQNGVTITHR